MNFQILNKILTQDWIDHLIQYSDVYIVGGCVRDMIMNQTPKDIDFIIDGLSYKSIENILDEYGSIQLVGKSFAVLKFTPFGSNEQYDIAIPRIDKKTGHGHKGFSVYTTNVTLNDDLMRRDFTINSIAINIETKEIIDPFGGVDDLKSKIIRATNTNTFIEDPLRILRAIQFASRFGFDIEMRTLQLMKKNSNLINEISKERILDEFDKIVLKGGSSYQAFNLIETCGIDFILFGKKFNRNHFAKYKNLDIVSFYYVLGKLGGVDSSEFYTNELRGVTNISIAIKNLQDFLHYYFGNDTKKSIEETKWKLFKIIQTSPIIENVTIFPLEVKNIIKDMKQKNIPMFYGDIDVNGDDLIKHFGVIGKDVGVLKNLMYRHALMNRFDWKNRNSVLKYLKNLQKTKKIS